MITSMLNSPLNTANEFRTTYNHNSTKLSQNLQNTRNFYFHLTQHFITFNILAKASSRAEFNQSHFSLNFYQIPQQQSTHWSNMVDGWGPQNRKSAQHYG